MRRRERTVSRLSARTHDTLRDVLARFGVTSGAIHDIRAGRVNKHWRIVSPDAVYALRRYNARRSRAAIRYEHDILDLLAHHGWPVAAPLRGLNGETVVEVERTRY